MIPRNPKAIFLSGEIHFLTLQAALSTRSRNFPVYAQEVTPSKRARFREALVTKLNETNGVYESDQVLDEQHCQHIEGLSDSLSSSDFGKYLHKGRFRIGVAQKALNLHLKFLWCLGFIREPPPHCPFDNIVIRTLENCEGINWTEFDDSLTYEHLVHQARHAADKKGLSLAEWELELYNRS